MGWVSYLEDVTERLKDDLDRLTAAGLSPARSQAKPTIDEAAIRAWIDRAKGVLRQLREHLDLATDPSLELAARVTALEQENQRLSDQVMSLTAAREGDMSAARLEKEHALAALRARFEKQYTADQRLIDRMGRKIDQLTSERAELERKLTAMLETPRADLYEQYSSPEAIRRHKPGA